MSEDRMIAYIQMGSAMAIVGSLVTASKMTVDRIPPHLASELRFIVAAAVLILLLYQREGGFHFRRNRPHLSLLFWQAFFGTYLFNLCLMYGVRWTTGVESGIITSFTPAAVGLLSFLLLRERPGWIRWVGILFVVLGTGVIQVPGAAGGDSSGDDIPVGQSVGAGGGASVRDFLSLWEKIDEPCLPPMSPPWSVCMGLLFLPGTLEELSVTRLGCRSLGRMGPHSLQCPDRHRCRLFVDVGVSRLPASSGRTDDRADAGQRRPPLRLVAGRARHLDPRAGHPGRPDRNRPHFSGEGAGADDGGINPDLPVATGEKQPAHWGGRLLSHMEIAIFTIRVQVYHQEAKV